MTSWNDAPNDLDDRNDIMKVAGAGYIFCIFMCTKYCIEC